MVKVTTSYACEVCGFTSADEVRVQTCEAQGVSGSKFKIGDFVGTGVHAWWTRDCMDWALTMPVLQGELHYPVGARYGDLAKTTDDTVFIRPMVNWFLPIFVVVGVHPRPCHYLVNGMGDHRPAIHLWSPRHANMVSSRDKLVWTRSDALFPIPDAMKPDTSPFAGRLSQVIAKTREPKWRENSFVYA